MAKIDWTELQTEEIKLKQVDFSNQYETLKNYALDMLEQLDIIEEEYNRATVELHNRGEF